MPSPRRPSVGSGMPPWRSTATRCGAPGPAALFLYGKINAAQFEVSQRWSRLSSEYRKAIGAQPPWVKPGTLGTGIVGSPAQAGEDPAHRQPGGPAAAGAAAAGHRGDESALAALGVRC